MLTVLCSIITQKSLQLWRIGLAEAHCASHNGTMAELDETDEIGKEKINEEEYA